MVMRLYSCRKCGVGPSGIVPLRTEKEVDRCNVLSCPHRKRPETVSANTFPEIDITLLDKNKKPPINEG